MSSLHHSKHLYPYVDVVNTILDLDTYPSLIIVDSIQTMATETCQNSAGSIPQIRESTATFLQLAKATGIAVIILGHVTKSGEIAGPRVLEHMVRRTHL